MPELGHFGGDKLPDWWRVLPFVLFQKVSVRSFLGGAKCRKQRGCYCAITFDWSVMGFYSLANLSTRF